MICVEIGELPFICQLQPSCSRLPIFFTIQLYNSYIHTIHIHTIYMHMHIYIYITYIQYIQYNVQHLNANFRSLSDITAHENWSRDKIAVLNTNKRMNTAKKSIFLHTPWVPLKSLCESDQSNLFHFLSLPTIFCLMGDTVIYLCCFMVLATIGLPERKELSSEIAVDFLCNWLALMIVGCQTVDFWKVNKVQNPHHQVANPLTIEQLI